MIDKHPKYGSDLAKYIADEIRSRVKDNLFDSTKETSAEDLLMRMLCMAPGAQPEHISFKLDDDYGPGGQTIRFGNLYTAMLHTCISVDPEATEYDGPEGKFWLENGEIRFRPAVPVRRIFCEVAIGRDGIARPKD